MKLFLGRFLGVVPEDQMDTEIRNGHYPLPEDDGVADRAMADLRKHFRDISVFALPAATAAISKFMPRA